MPRLIAVTIGRLRTRGLALGQAHLALLRAELSVAGRELAIVAGLAAALLLLATLLLILLWVGGWLFLGEWLFGSLGWGVLHGTLATVLVCVPIALELAGGPPRVAIRGLVAGAAIGLIVAIVLGAGIAGSGARFVGETLAEATGQPVVAQPALAGLVLWGIVGAFVAALVARGRSGIGRSVLVGAIAGAIIGLALVLLPFAWDVAAAIGVTIGLLAAIGVTLLLATRAGIDPGARYDRLVPRASIAAAEETRAWARAEWDRLLRRATGR